MIPLRRFYAWGILAIRVSRLPALICHCEELPLIPSLSRDVAMVVRRRVFNLDEIATWFDRLRTSGWLISTSLKKPR